MDHTHFQFHLIADMSDNTMLVMFFALIILCNVLFNGDPDLVDALIKYLMK